MGFSKFVPLILLAFIPFVAASWWNPFERPGRFIMDDSPGECEPPSKFISSDEEWCKDICVTLYGKDVKGVCDWSALSLWTTGTCECWQL
ncbi:hypothetical protein BUALT_Bualt02G0103500 [Buddleja alternifolia]|uniref:Uncharacterized protein n=1 Tax=Buddleja alternifolia TaxID=168488 RepID=A0AAV6Y9X0_9LAMI|nr:hypothetical protein BUALT_Bualt02G0103500 [Buddleja alternifolia]